MKNILIISIGGTIAMTSDSSGGIVPNISIEDLLESAPNITKLANIETLSPFVCPASSIQLPDFLSLINIIEEKLNSNYDGALLIQGTDTIEETAFLLDILINSKKPIVVTGAMRGHAMLSADGPSNLTCSIKTLIHPLSKNLGTLVVLNETIHSGRFVVKSNTSNLEAFTSPSSGPIGHIIENEPVFLMKPLKKIDLNLSKTFKFGRVPIITFGIGDDSELLEKASKIDYDGYVLQATGAGHIPSSIVSVVEKIATKKPVILSTRVIGGRVFKSTYGFSGSEIDLINKGVITSGFLNASKSRLLLGVLTGNNFNLKQIAEYFNNF